MYVVEDTWTSLQADRIANVPLGIGAIDQDTSRLLSDILTQFRAITATFFAPEEDARLEPVYGRPAAYERDLISDFTFAAMMRCVAQFHRAQGHAVYPYRFADPPDEVAVYFEGLHHSSELP